MKQKFDKKEKSIRELDALLKDCYTDYGKPFDENSNVAKVTRKTLAYSNRLNK